LSSHVEPPETVWSNYRYRAVNPGKKSRSGDAEALSQQVGSYFVTVLVLSVLEGSSAIPFS
jgi:hypothetical protein